MSHHYIKTLTWDLQKDNLRAIPTQVLVKQNLCHTPGPVITTANIHARMPGPIISTANIHKSTLILAPVKNTNWAIQQLTNYNIHDYSK